jgi:hypothetical protein
MEALYDSLGSVSNSAFNPVIFTGINVVQFSAGN